ncbi:MAG: hypothetical protein K2L12_01350, partial [Clostridia bacterium]|nr:hypothetical protein [Clostridia bacterium]
IIAFYKPEGISVTEDKSQKGVTLNLEVNPWKDGEGGEEETVRKACRKVIDYAVQNSCKNVVFDTQSFTDDQADVSYIANILTEELSDISENGALNDVTVTVLFPSGVHDEDFIDELEEELAKPVIQVENHAYGDYGDPLKGEFEKFQKKLSKKETFRERLVDIMNQRGVRKGSEVYIPSGVSKSTFSKIINFRINPPYKPSKETVAALSIGLKLKLQEAEEFYALAGFHLGETEFVDRVVRFFIGKGIYRIYDVNYCMIEHGYPPLGEKSRGDKGR